MAKKTSKEKTSKENTGEEKTSKDETSEEKKSEADNSNAKSSWFRKLFIEETSNTFIQFFRSLFVGGAATVVDIIVLIICRELFHTQESIGAAVGFVFGVTVNYIISTLWVFAKAKVENRTKDFIFFVIIGIIGALLTELIIAPFSMEGMFGEGFFVTHQTFGALIPADKYYIVGKFIAVVLVYIWNFCARKFILYRNCEE